MILVPFIILILVGFVQGSGLTDSNDEDNPRRRGNLLYGSEGTYACYSCDSHNCDEASLCYNALQCYSSRIRDSYGIESLTKGCASSRERVNFYCNKKHGNDNAQYSISCCSGDLCNNGSFPELSSLMESRKEKLTERSTLLTTVICVIVAFAVISVFIVVVVMAVNKRRRKERMDAQILNSCSQGEDFYDDDLRATAAGDSTLKEIFDHSVTSGSGSGLPLLIQRTFAKNISLQKCIGKGRFGEVWLGMYHGEQLAVKIFSSREEASWHREIEIYGTELIRHENILGYIASDMTSRNSCTQLWLVTHYHAMGSLYDYINASVLDAEQTISILLTTISGLVHLHTEIFGAKGKPAIAHRDIKSKNILMKAHGVCAIADFGLAVTHSQMTGELNLASNPSRVGTKRYMAPEILDDTINSEVFESYRRVDMYAFGLVLWEVITRCSVGGLAEDYKPPFHDYVGADPSFDDMRRVVCTNQHRPCIPNRWSSDPKMTQLSRLMKECWHQIPSARLTALRVKKTLIKISNSDVTTKVDV